MTGIELIAFEREEQISKHGYTIEKDVLYNSEFQLTDAAYVLAQDFPNELKNHYENNPPIGWNLNIWKRMINKPYERRLIIAGALIAAEIDRIRLKDLNT